ncbi:MAG: HAD family phosphatase [Candidatus Moranbacteria bacterium]|jgi:HAD superfamily hydrolase (TIGR01509 family)|nr:HAD family phosphatase [Candidatus Moranbacteria bacterium]NTV55324.1 HAD family phosphatase [Candidatus Moranbacteria bacterium]
MSNIAKLEELFGRPFQAVVFDMDGVIVDSERLHLRANREIALRHGMSVPADAWEDIFGMKSVDGFRMIRDRFGTGQEDIDRLVTEKRQRFLELANDNLTLVPEVRTFIDFCRADIGKIGLATSALLSVQMPTLDRFGLSDMFDAIVMGDDVTHGKPHPEPYLLAASRLGVDPDTCLVIEDAENGIRSAKAAGCVAVGLATTLSREKLIAAGADLVVDGFDELM